MEIRRPDPQPRDDGDYLTYVNGVAYGKPQARIHLDEAKQLVLAGITLDDARRLAKAAVQVEQELAAAHAQMTAPHGGDHFYKGTCQLCGKPEDDALHAEPRCEATEDGVRCTEAPGHDGHHYGPDTGGGIRKMWLISDATIAQARWLAEHPLDEEIAAAQDDDEAGDPQYPDVSGGGVPYPPLEAGQIALPGGGRLTPYAQVTP